MRVKTDFKGWQSDVDFQKNEEDRQKRVEAAIAAYEKMQRNRKQDDSTRRLSATHRWTIILASVGFGCWMLYQALNWVLRQFGL